ncbi:MAG: nitrous-oxide reductase accessory protein NosL [Ignavibacteria bacterium]|nr:MAG: nitrous-oxide reductase accessory protein NosL [Ignavibacteria bacterium]KAF0155769.1 MAG: nitrous-oxide reductase accessory protein NosL [Ignavibacteria bacterium]
MLSKILLFAFIAAGLMGCSKEPQPINYNKDECAHCIMIITDPKFGSELVTDKGKIYKFDSIECLADFVSIDSGFTAETLWISDYANPNTLIDAKTAYYIISPKMESPMGMNIGGFKDQKEMEKVFAVMGGEKMNWEEVLSYVKNSK